MADDDVLAAEGLDDDEVLGTGAASVLLPTSSGTAVLFPAVFTAAATVVGLAEDELGSGGVLLPTA